ncbi:MAG: hypothetical protein ACYDBQ_06570 [Thermoplasmatota archaeon]
MNTLAYALAGCLIILAMPMVGADIPQTNPPNHGTAGGQCDFFVYWLNPPGFRIDPSCLLPPG